MAGGGGRCISHTSLGPAPGHPQKCRPLFCSSLIFSEENRTKLQNLHQVRKQKCLAREEVSILTPSKDDTLHSKGFHAVPGMKLFTQYETGPLV